MTATSTSGGKRPRISIVGAGSVAEQYHLPAIRYLNGELATLVDRNPALLEEACRAWRPRNGSCDAAAVTPANTDLCIVATPPATHAEIALALLERKVPVLIEKPVALTLAELDALQEVAARTGTPCWGANVRRFFPNIEQLGALVGSGLFGRPRSITVAEGGLFNWPTASGYPGQAGDEGVTTDTGAHCLDLLLFLAPMDLADLELRICAVDQYPRTNTLHLEFRSASTGVEYRLKISRTIALSNRILVTTDRASVRTWSTFSLEDLLVTPHRANAEPWRVSRPVPRHNVRFAFVRQLDHVLRNLRAAAPERSRIGLAALRGYVGLFEVIRRRHTLLAAEAELGAECAEPAREVA